MRLLTLTFIIFLVFTDYLSKTLIKNNFDQNFYVVNEYISIQIFYNKGVAFSLFHSPSILVNIILTLIISIIILFLLYIFLKDFSRLSRTELFGYIFLISGATANLLDRLLNGSVLDFLIINYNQIYFPAVFNVADIFISFGALLIITSYVFRPNK
ncbi:MAG: signal peptidase II [Gammaproteobacteria bacterium]|jgi:signal peptidase II|nr:signal peptidase II [Gammaproteobacteria bacterium]|tara:strand:+ start:787 stop:1254 length:468 start_codon:yes stop_codon:yes gene_type:complete